MDVQPVVSVILPTYNRGRMLRESVESVLGQTFADWELIVVDDGSTDDSREYVLSLPDRRVHLVPIAHSGSAAWARNAGIARARGEWIAFLDSDDLWTASKLELQLVALRLHPKCQWSCTGFSFIDENGAPTHQRAGAPYRPLSGWILEPLITFAATASTPTLVVRRSLIDDVGGFDEALLSREDYDLMLRLARQSEILALGDSLTLIREHPSRTTKGLPAAQLHGWNERVFRKTAHAATDGRIRSLCLRQCARERVAQARALAADGDRTGAAAAIVRAAWLRMRVLLKH